MTQIPFESWLYGDEDVFPEGMNGDFPYSADVLRNLVLPPEPDPNSFRLEPENPHKTTAISSIDLSNWKDYPGVSTNSLWLIPSRSQDGMHTASFHGNFIPQIPFQAMIRYTEQGDVVLDPFLGSGTTLIQCRQMGRHGIGIELSPEIANNAEIRINSERNDCNVWTEVITGDSTDAASFDQVRTKLEQHNRQSVQLIIMHPPYHDIIRFTDNPNDLSNAPTRQAFLQSFRKVVDNTYDLLDEGRFLVVVIGDKYSRGEWIPLGFETMQVVQERGYRLKSIVVKNMEGNRAKRNLENLWRRRALQGGFYIFKHEYVLFFEKTPAEEKLTPILQQAYEYIEAMDKAEGYDLLDSGWKVDPITQLVRFRKSFESIDPSRILLLRDSKDVRAALIDLTEQELTDKAVDELQQIIAQLQPKAVEVYAIAGEDEQRDVWGIEGVTFVYAPDAIAYAARGMYAVRKSTGWGQRVGQREGERFSRTLNSVLAESFVQDDEYVYSAKQELAFRFFKKDRSAPFRSARARDPNFHMGVVVKWVDGHETEKLPQIRDKYFNKNYTLIAIIGPNANTWQKAIQNPQWGDFAHYYLFVERDAKLDGTAIVTNSQLWHTVDGELVQSSYTLLSLLNEQSKLLREK
jgi:DNA modification methylase